MVGATQVDESFLTCMLTHQALLHKRNHLSFQPFPPKKSFNSVISCRSSRMAPTTLSWSYLPICHYQIRVSPKCHHKNGFRRYTIFNHCSTDKMPFYPFSTLRETFILGKITMLSSHRESSHFDQPPAPPSPCPAAAPCPGPPPPPPPGRPPPPAQSLPRRRPVPAPAPAPAQVLPPPPRPSRPCRRWSPGLVTTTAQASPPALPRVSSPRRRPRPPVCTAAQAHRGRAVAQGHPG
jgi:hypothetical protein